jgi:hypothetical protein
LAFAPVGGNEHAGVKEGTRHGKVLSEAAPAFRYFCKDFIVSQ